ncbi:MAG: sigma-70 family RNA polymerase sigma factor [Sandaracinaceae bacterium]|nr:sigma-70 family RNA polymerase sigma factor [Sandaracinaceae bacterium]
MSVDLSALAKSLASRDDRTAAEAALCAHFGPILRLYGRRHLGDAGAAEDLAQDALATVLVLLRAGRLEDGERLGGFVLGVARNKVHEARRTRARSRRAVPAVPDAHEPAYVGFRMHLWMCLSQLTERARAVLERTYFADEDAGEIADALTLTPNHVRVLRHRALAEVRRCLEGDAS